MSLQVTGENSKIFKINEPDLGGSGALGSSAKKEGTDNTFILARLPNLDNGEFMLDGFIQLNRCEKTFFLLKNFPNAFLLLTLIALRARRTPHPYNEMEIGEAYIGDWNSCGLTRKEYRTALAYLERQEILLISQTNKKCKKRATSEATSRTTRGTIVKLLDSELWNVNFNIDNQSKGHLSGHSRATLGPPRGHKQERKEREECKEEEEDIVSKDTLAPTPPSRRKNISRTIDPITFCFESGKFEGISEIDLQDWKVAYPNADASKQLAAQAQWLKANPSRANKKNWRKFITNWLSKADEKALNRIAFSQAVPSEKLSIRSKIEEKFQRGKFYNGAECLINEDGVAFQRGMNHRQLKFSEKGFPDQFKNLLMHFGISDD